jgi:hypothetical protein
LADDKKVGKEFAGWIAPRGKAQERTAKLEGFDEALHRSSKQVASSAVLAR